MCIMSQLDPAHPPCPICRAANATTLYAVTAREAAQHFVLAEVDPQRHERLAIHIAALWRRDSCRLLRCTGCGFVYADPFVAGDANFYTLAYGKQHEKSYPAWKWEYDQTMSALKVTTRKHDPREVRLLEIGAGTGVFSKRLAELGFTRERIVTTEYSDFGRFEIERAGITCKPEDVRSPTFDRMAGFFDVICLFQVVEHMDRLDDLFERLHELACDSADLFIAVPNERRIEFNERNGGLLDMPPNHIGRWNHKCFDIIGRRHGLNVVEHRYERPSFLPSAMQFAAYHYLRRAQCSTSFANRIERTAGGLSPMLRKSVRVSGVALAALPAISALVQVGGPQLGDSQWCHFIKS
jgi:SAM-dependent methyltransferase